MWYYRSTGTTWTYRYDLGGNILSKQRYAYTTGDLGTALDTTSYGYTDANWKDKLTAYKGQTLTYDEIGNLLSDGGGVTAGAAADSGLV